MSDRVMWSGIVIAATVLMWLCGATVLMHAFYGEVVDAIGSLVWTALFGGMVIVAAEAQSEAAE